MRFKFYPKQSRIYDFLYFPRIVFPKESKHSSEFRDVFDVIVEEDHKHLMSFIEKSLLPYEKQIHFFYLKDHYNKYDFIDLIHKTFSIKSFKDELSYLEYLLSIDPVFFNKHILKSIMIIESDDDDFEPTEDSVDDIFNHLVDFINDLNIDSSFKWNLLMIFGDPIKYVKQYVDLMKSLYPIFLETYMPYVETIEKVGTHLEYRLNTDTDKTLRQLTGNRVNPNIIQVDECELYISILFPYFLKLYQTKERFLFVWGRYMEDAFKRLATLNEDQVNMRVKIFKALGDRTRYDVLKHISKGVSSNKELAEKLNVSTATISYHIDEFITTGLISIDKNNRKLGYKIDKERLENAWEGFKKELDL